MADYIYLLENRLSPAQQRALSTVRNVVRARELTLFLTGGAVRDLTGGGSVRDLDITIQGETTSLRADIEATGALLTGEFAPSQSLFFTFPGGIRVEVSAAMAVTYPKPGKPVYELASISDDLRRRDFTANAMALSLNEGSYGLLMDPLNGVADIENRELRLISNYGFIEDPARLLRAVRISSRLGWQMEARTQQRYENAREDTTFDILSQFARGYEMEEIFHEEDPQRILRALDAEGWLSKLSPLLTLGKANEQALSDARDKQGQLQTQGILTDGAALFFPLLTAKMPPADVAALKASFARQGFVREIETVEERTREFQTRFTGKEAAVPSAAWRLLYDAESSLVLSMFYSSKSGAVQSRLKTFLTESPTARQRLPYAVMQEMRITPDNPVYGELLDKVFFELMDGKLTTPEEMKAYLEPYSPPAPPPPLNLRRARAKKEARPSRAKAKKVAATVIADEESVAVAEGLMEPGTLTGPDRGTEPTAHQPLEGNVAPLAPGAAEPPAGEPVPAKKPVLQEKKVAVKKTVPATSLSAETGSAAARKLSPTPTPAPEAENLLPHPDATKEIARSSATPSVVVPAASAEPVPAKNTSAAATKKPTPGKVVVALPAKPAPGTVKTAPAKAAAKSTPAKHSAPGQAPTPAKKAAVPPGQKSVAAKTPVSASAGKNTTSGSTPKKTSAPQQAPAASAGRSTPAAKTPDKTLAKAAAKAPAKAAAKTPIKAAAAKTTPAAAQKKAVDVPGKPAKKAVKTPAKSARR